MANTHTPGRPTGNWKQMQLFEPADGSKRAD